MRWLTFLIIVAGCFLIGLALWHWLSAPERPDRLMLLVFEEGGNRTLPTGFPLQMLWLVKHRALHLWRYRLWGALALAMAVTEGVVWRQRQTFRGFHRLLWMSSGPAIATAIAAMGVACVWYQPVTGLTAGVCIGTILVGLVWAGFALSSGFPALR
jgi:hypothetical protein